MAGASLGRVPADFRQSGPKLAAITAVSTIQQKRYFPLGATLRPNLNYAHFAAALQGFLAVPQDPPGYWIEDTSTNGTLINGNRIPKGSSAPVKEGDRVQLSWNAAGEAAALLEYAPHHHLVNIKLCQTVHLLLAQECICQQLAALSAILPL